MAEVDRDVEVVFPGVDLPFPAPSAYDDLDPCEPDDLWGRAPWFDRRCLSHVDLLRRYADSRDELPGSIPVGATQTWTWSHQYSFVNSDLHVPRQRGLHSIKVEFAVSVNKGLNKLFTWDVPDAELNVDMCLFRTRGESDYVDALQGITDAQLEAWRQGLTGDNPTLVDAAALRITKPVLCVDFRFLKARDIRFIDKEVRNERRLRSLTGRMIPYHISQFHCYRRRYLEENFVGHSSSWRRLEVASGCIPTIPAVMTYKNSELLDPSSGWWVVAFTEWAAQVAGTVLGDVYDTFRLWHLPDELIAAIRSLDLIRVVGNAENVAELQRLLRVIESTNWDNKPTNWHDRPRRSGPNAVDRAPGRRRAGADFIYYDPWHRKEISELDALRKTSVTLVKPTDYPARFDWDAPIPPVTWDDVSGEVQHSDDDDDGWSNALDDQLGYPAASSMPRSTVPPSLGPFMQPSMMGNMPPVIPAPVVAPPVVPGVASFPQYGFAPPASVPMPAISAAAPSQGTLPMPGSASAFVPVMGQAAPSQPLSLPPVAAPVQALTPQAQLESARAFLRMAGYPEAEIQGDLAALTALIRNLRQG